MELSEGSAPGVVDFQKMYIFRRWFRIASISACQVVQFVPSILGRWLSLNLLSIGSHSHHPKRCSTPHCDSCICLGVSVQVPPKANSLLKDKHNLIMNHDESGRNDHES